MHLADRSYVLVVLTAVLIVAGTWSSDPSFTGLYHVFFPQDISNCAVVVSQGESSNNGFFPGTFYLAVVQSDPNNNGNPNEVNVTPTDATGTPKDAGFDLIVAC